MRVCTSIEIFLYLLYESNLLVLLIFDTNYSGALSIGLDIFKNFKTFYSSSHVVNRGEKESNLIVQNAHSTHGASTRQDILD